MDSFFGLDRASKVDEKLELLTTLHDEISLVCVESILRDAEIPYLVKHRGAGSSMRVIMGFSLFAADVFVLRETLETAQALIAPTESDEELDGEDEDIESIEDIED